MRVKLALSSNLGNKFATINECSRVQRDSGATFIGLDRGRQLLSASCKVAPHWPPAPGGPGESRATQLAKLKLHEARAGSLDWQASWTLRVKFPSRMSTELRKWMLLGLTSSLDGEGNLCGGNFRRRRRCFCFSLRLFHKTNRENSRRSARSSPIKSQ